MSCCSAQPAGKIRYFWFCGGPAEAITNAQALTTTCPEGGLKEKKGRSGERTAQV
jgi:hypothetical protein